MDDKKLDISWGAILKVAVAVVCLYIFYIIKDILIWFVFAVIIYILFNPFISFLQRRKIPRILAAVFVYVGFFGIISLLIYLMVPILIFEIRSFIQTFPEYFEQISPLLRNIGFEAFQNFNNFLIAFKSILDAMSSNIFSGLFIFFGGVFTSLFIIITAFFLSLEDKAVEKTLLVLFPKKYEIYVLNLFERCEKKVTGWFLARIIAGIFVGVSCYITFLIIHIDYPFTLALFAGIFNFVPYIGPLISGIVIFLFVFPIEMIKGIFVIIVFILIQQIENQIITPILMKMIVNLSPAIVLIGLAIGGKLWGFMGALLIVPLLGILFEFGREFLQKRKEKELLESEG